MCLRGSYSRIFKHFKFCAWTSVSKLAMLWVGPSRVPYSSPSVQRDHVHEELNQIHVKEEQIRGELSYLAPLGSENISAPYFKQCFFQGGGEGVLPPRLSQTPRLPVPRQK